MMLRVGHRLGKSSSYRKAVVARDDGSEDEGNKNGPPGPQGNQNGKGPRRGKPPPASSIAAPITPTIVTTSTSTSSPDLTPSSFIFTSAVLTSSVDSRMSSVLKTTSVPSLVPISTSSQPSAPETTATPSTTLVSETWT